MITDEPGVISFAWVTSRAVSGREVAGIGDCRAVTRVEDVGAVGVAVAVVVRAGIVRFAMRLGDIRRVVRSASCCAKRG